MKIFISSTYKDLVDYRRAAIEAVLKLELEVIAMEFFNSRPEDPKTVCEREVDECDLFIGIYGHRYGFIPKGGKKSITHLEYELARKLGKPCFCFIVDRNHPWLPLMIDNIKMSKLEGFLDVVREELTIEKFSTPIDIGYKISTSLSRYLVNEENFPASSEKSSNSLSRSRKPRVFHKLPKAAYWQDRPEYKKLLHWWVNAENGICLLQGIGGAGKSSIISKFIFDEISEKNNVNDRPIFVFSMENGTPDTFLSSLGKWLSEGSLEKPLAYQDTLELMENTEKLTIVIDSLDLYQSKGDNDEPIGTIIHKNLRDLISRISSNWLPNISIIVASRFPITCLSYDTDTKIKIVDLSPLSIDDSISLMRRRGVSGSDFAVERVAQKLGGHPLLIDLVGGYMSIFNSGRLGKGDEWKRIEDVCDRVCDQALPIKRNLLIKNEMMCEIIDDYLRILGEESEPLKKLFIVLCVFRRR